MKALEIGRNVGEFVVRRVGDVPERNARLHLLEHKGTGAQVLHIACNDDNKVFAIGFRTPPSDGTGVAHILEHSVLAGSEKFRTKEPFVDLLKTSLKTFLNAFTASDHTIYPVASRNTEDFRNLVRVYLDAAFFPLMRRETFEQEGWHLHCEGPDAPLELKGVVYNEMKGAYGDPFRALYKEFAAGLLPDTCYRHDSGGNPAHIPDLTYEQFVEFHRSYYHPSNSLTVIYGDMDLEATLAIIEREAFSQFQRSEKRGEVKPQTPFSAPRDVKAAYGIGGSDAPTDKTYIAKAWGLGTHPSPEEGMAQLILSRLLMETEASPLKNALIGSELGQDTVSMLEKDLMNQCILMGVSESNPERAEEVFALIDSTLKSIASQGFERRLLEAVLARLEFSLREADFGGWPKGLVLGMDALTAWVTGTDPMEALSWEETFRKISKAALEESYFERMIEEKLLRNPHQIRFVLSPEPGLAEREEAALFEKLQKKKKEMPPKELETVIEKTRSLVAFQEREDAPEDVAALPQLSISSVKREADDFRLETLDDGLRFIASDSNGIAYLRASFSLDHLTADEIPWASLLAETLTTLGTTGMSHIELSQEIGILTGGVSARVSASGHRKDTSKVNAHFTLAAKFTYEKAERALALLRSLLLEQDFGNGRRLKELSGMAYSQAKSALVGDAFEVGLLRAQGSLSAHGRFDELASGLDYFNFVKALGETDVGAKLRAVAQRIVNRANLAAISFSSEAPARARLQGQIRSFLAELPQGSPSTASSGPALSTKNSAIALPAQVQYVFMAESLRGKRQSPALMSLCHTYLRLGHLWQEIRVKGGAYGAQFIYDRVTEELVLGSYRDPNLERTLEAYRAIPRVMSEFSPSEREFESLKIGTFGNIDKPFTPSQKLGSAHSYLLAGVSQEDIQQERDRLFALTASDMRAAAEVFQTFLESAAITVSGNAQNIENARSLFSRIDAVVL